MIVALIDNGSLEPAAHRNLRAVAAALSARTGLNVHAVSWKHSDRIAPAALDGTPAWTIAPWIRAQLARGEREFVFVPFFISAQGAIGSALRGDLEKLRPSSAALQRSPSPTASPRAGASRPSSPTASAKRDRGETSPAGRDRRRPRRPVARLRRAARRDRRGGPRPARRRDRPARRRLDGRR